jgi:homoserine kinase
MNKQITVTIPATTANLGPGYDCLGLALALYNEVSLIMPVDEMIPASNESEDSAATQLSISISGTDAGKITIGADNLVAKAADLVFHRIGRRPRRLCIHLQNSIPVGSGLGSSSAAILGGMLAANELINGRLTREDILLMATELEGHPDNVAPALYGGLILGVMARNEENKLAVIIEKIAVPPLRAVVVLPDFPFSTTEARAVLPGQISRKDAIFNSSRLGLLIRALQTADYPRLRLAMQDRLHQPYRLPLIPGSEAAIAAAYASGAAGVALSGAGPALIAILPADINTHAAVRDAISAAFMAAGLTSRSWILATDEAGCRVSAVRSDDEIADDLQSSNG